METLAQHHCHKNLTRPKTNIAGCVVHKWSWLYRRGKQLGGTCAVIVGTLTISTLKWCAWHQVNLSLFWELCYCSPFLFTHSFLKLHSSPCHAVILCHTDYRHASVSELDSYPTDQCLCYPVRLLFLCFLFRCNADTDHACHTSAQVVGCIVEHEGKILLCKRGIEPCKWTLPAGYMELKESSAGMLSAKLA